MEPIKTHKDLARFIEGKVILHSNSLGKDSVACLEWLCTYASPAKIYSLRFKLMASHPDDERYYNYLKKRYPNVEFMELQDPAELTVMISGVYQTPVQINTVYAHFEYVAFTRHACVMEVIKKYGIDFVCRGESKYESFARASKFHRVGLLSNLEIFPIGLMTRDQLLSIFAVSGLKIHPYYKFTVSGYDNPSYWKMRSSIVANPAYWQSLLKVYPMLELDKFRYEVLLKNKVGESRCR